MLRACRNEIPGVESMSPAEVFELVRDALKAAQSKPLLIERRKRAAQESTA